MFSAKNMPKKLSRASAGKVRGELFLLVARLNFFSRLSGLAVLQKIAFSAQGDSGKAESAGTLECPLRIPGFKILNPSDLPGTPTAKTHCGGVYGGQGVPLSVQLPSLYAGQGRADRAGRQGRQGRQTRQGKAEQGRAAQGRARQRRPGRASMAVQAATRSGTQAATDVQHKCRLQVSDPLRSPPKASRMVWTVACSSHVGPWPRSQERRVGDHEKSESSATTTRTFFVPASDDSLDARLHWGERLACSKKTFSFVLSPMKARAQRVVARRQVGRAGWFPMIRPKFYNVFVTVPASENPSRPARWNAPTRIF